MPECHPVEGLTLKHCLTTTLQSNSETLLVVAQRGGGGMGNLTCHFLGLFTYLTPRELGVQPYARGFMAGKGVRSELKVQHSCVGVFPES